MIDIQLYNYFRYSQTWQKQTDRVSTVTVPSKSRYHARLMMRLGRWLVTVGQHLQHIGEPTYQTANQTHG